MATQHLHPVAAEPDSAAADSPASGESVRFMCSFGGKILPRPHDNQLRYVGGETRIVSVPRRSTSFSLLLAKLSRLARAGTDVAVKYQLPNEDLDALITIASDEDLENMMDEHDRNPGSRLRLFLFPNDPVSSRTSSISSLLDGSTKRQNWFLDALNGRPETDSGPALERGRSEASSMVSEVPDYLFGLDNSDDQPKTKSKLSMIDTVSNSDPGSPAPVVSSPFYSASSSIPDLAPGPARPSFHPAENFQAEQPVRHYVPEATYAPPGVQQIPFYYVPGSNVPVHAVQVRSPYAPSYQPVPIGYNDARSGMGQVYGVGPRPIMVDPHNMPNRVINMDNMNQPVYYRSPFPGMVAQGGEDLDRINQPR